MQSPGGRLSVSEAARLLQLSERQVQRLKRRDQPDSVPRQREGNCYLAREEVQLEDHALAI